MMRILTTTDEPTEHYLLVPDGAFDYRARLLDEHQLAVLRGDLDAIETTDESTEPPVATLDTIERETGTDTTPDEETDETASERATMETADSGAMATGDTVVGELGQMPSIDARQQTVDERPLKGSDVQTARNLRNRTQRAVEGGLIDTDVADDIKSSVAGGELEAAEETLEDALEGVDRDEMEDDPLNHVDEFFTIHSPGNGKGGVTVQKAYATLKALDEADDFWTLAKEIHISEGANSSVATYLKKLSEAGFVRRRKVRKGNQYRQFGYRILNPGRTYIELVDEDESTEITATARAVQ